MVHNRDTSFVWTTNGILGTLTYPSDMAYRSARYKKMTIIYEAIGLIIIIIISLFQRRCAMDNVYIHLEQCHTRCS